MGTDAGSVAKAGAAGLGAGGAAKKAATDAGGDAAGAVAMGASTGAACGPRSGEGTQAPKAVTPGSPIKTGGERAQVDGAGTVEGVNGAAKVAKGVGVADGAGATCGPIKGEGTGAPREVSPGSPTRKEKG